MNIPLLLSIVIAKSLIVSSFRIDPRDRYKSVYGHADDDFISYNATTDTLNIRWSIIYPGTKWCGNSDVASSYYDLGSERSADLCCRTHDHCDDYIPAGEMKHGLINLDFIAKLSCECDERFRQCLRAAGSDTAHFIGIIYFNLLNRQCFSRNWFTFWEWERVQFNNAFRAVLGLPRYCSASGMFSQAHTDCFYATIRKRCASLVRRTRASTNAVLAMIAGRIDCPYIRRCCDRHVVYRGGH